MTINTIAALLIGLIFLVIGVFASRFYKWEKIKTFIPIIIGLFLIYISTIGPLSTSKKRIHLLTKIDSNKVGSIMLQRTRVLSYQDLNMLNHDTILSNRKLIDEICLALHKAEIAGEGFLKNPQSVCRVQINMIDKTTIVFGVRKAGKATCLTVDSKGESGWHFANLDASEFGRLLDEILR